MVNGQGHLSENTSFHDYVIRVTPNPMRSDSSNINPQEFWNFGISLVALNYQTPGLMMDLQEGKFLANGACGYVLKPAIMRTQELFSPIEKLSLSPQVVLHRFYSFFFCNGLFNNLQTQFEEDGKLTLFIKIKI